MPLPRIVGLGLCVVDHLFVVDRLDLPDVRTRFHEQVVAAGGMTATALAQAARLGCNTHVLSLLGDDAGGRFVRRALRSHGVNTRRLLLRADSETTLAVVLVERGSGDRRFLVPDRRALERGAPDFDLSGIERGTVLLVDGHFPAQALRAVRRARRVGAVVVGDFHRPGPVVRRLLPYVDHPIVSEEFARTLGTDDPRDALHWLRERGAAAPVVTLGRRGGVYLDGTRVRRYRAHRVKVRDTTGAGDVFHGAFAAGLLRGDGLAESLDLAARAGALACTALGGSGRLLRRDDLPHSR